MATTPVFLSVKSHEQRSLAGYSPWSCKDSDVTGHTMIITLLYFYVRYSKHVGYSNSD